MTKSFPIAALALAAAAPVTAQSAASKQVAAPVVAGQWNATMDTPGAAVAFQILFQAKGDSLFGTVKRASGDVALTGHIKGDSVRFEYTITYNENPFTMLLRGKIKGDSLVGIVDFGGGNEGAFTAKRETVKKDGGGLPAEAERKTY